MSKIPADILKLLKDARDAAALGNASFDWSDSHMTADCRSGNFEGRPDEFIKERVRLRQGGTLLVFVFVVWILNFYEVAAASNWLVQYQAPTESGRSRITGPIQVVQVANAIEVSFAIPNGNFCIFVNWLNEVREWTADPRFQCSSYCATESEWVIWRERPAVPDKQKIHPVIYELGIGSAVIDANNAYIERAVVPKFVQQPNIFNANFWTVRSDKLIFTGDPKLPSGPPQSNGRNCEDGGKKSDNFFVKVVENMSDPNKGTPDISDDRAGKGGAVFFVGIFLAGIVAYLIAGRKK